VALLRNPVVGNGRSQVEFGCQGCDQADNPQERQGTCCCKTRSMPFTAIFSEGDALQDLLAERPGRRGNSWRAAVRQVSGKGSEEACFTSVLISG